MVRRSLLLTLVACVPAAHPDDPPDVRPPITAGTSTLAGWAEPGLVDGPREINLFANPVGIALGPDGTAYVADFDNGAIRAVDAAGTASTVFKAPGFARPFALAARGSTLFVTTDNDPANAHGAMTGTIWAIDLDARTAEPLVMRMGRPRGLAVLRDGRLAVADYMHHVVELVDPATGAVTPLAGAWDAPGLADGVGADARFDTPYAIVELADGTIGVVDHDNAAVRVVALDGTVSTLVAGGLDHPQGLAVTAAGDLFVTDIGSYQVLRIRGEAIEVIAGDGTAGYVDAEDPLASQFHGLEGLAVSADGTQIYIADGTRGEALPYNRIRTVTLPR